MAELLHRPDKTIVIASSSLDAATWQPVAELLDRQGYDVVRYEADKVAAGSTTLEAEVSTHAGLRVRYDGRPLDLPTVAAAWCRRPTMFTDEDEADKALMLSLLTERSLTQGFLWEAIPERAWLNSPANMKRAEHKLTQLVIASQVGFTIPSHAVTTNSWDFAQATLPEDIVFKPAYPLIYINNDFMTVYTNQLKNPADLPLDKNPFPGFLQTYLRKAREWRITVVGDDIFDAAIYTGPDAQDDWRKHQLGPSVEFRKGVFPAVEKERCLRYLGEYGLRFGCFDFVEAPDGTITFLECNSNGQYRWLEEALSLPISEAIANELGSIADLTN